MNAWSKLPLSTAVFFSLFLAVSLAETVCAFLEKETGRKILKPFCLLFLFLGAVCAVPDSPWVYTGLVFGLVGDLFFLYPKKRKCVLFGLLAFFLNHVCFIGASCSLMKEIFPLLGYVLVSLGAALVFLAGFAVLLNKITKKDYLISVTGAFYMVSIVLDLFMVSYLTALKTSPYMYLGIIGGVLFIVSDSILTYTIFIRDFPRRDFYIMPTYLSAEALYTLSFVFSLLA